MTHRRPLGGIAGKIALGQGGGSRRSRLRRRCRLVIRPFRRQDHRCRSESGDGSGQCGRQGKRRSFEADRTAHQEDWSVEAGRHTRSARTPVLRSAVEPWSGGSRGSGRGCPRANVIEQLATRPVDVVVLDARFHLWCIGAESDGDLVGSIADDVEDKLDGDGRPRTSTTCPPRRAGHRSGCQTKTSTTCRATAWAWVIFVGFRSSNS